MSLESFMIELYLHIKIFLDYFPGRLKYVKLGKSTSFILSSNAKSCWIYTIIFISSYSAYIYLQNCIRVYDLIKHISPYSQNKSVKVYTNILLSSGGYNLKIIYLKNKMRHRMWVHILLKNLASSPLQYNYYF